MDDLIAGITGTCK